MDDATKTNIISELGLDTLPVEKQEEVLAKIGASIFQAVTARAIELLSDEDAKEFEKVIDGAKDNPESNAILEFLQAKIPNLEQIIAEEVEDFKTKSSEMMKNLS